MNPLTELLRDISRFDLKYPSLVQEAIRDLDTMVGIDSVKESIAEQVRYLLLRLSDQRQRKFPMLHTVIYGSPGVGKTELGKRLAKLWYALGVLSPATSSSVTASSTLSSTSSSSTSMTAESSRAVRELFLLRNSIFDLREKCERMLSPDIRKLNARSLVQFKTRKEVESELSDDWDGVMSELRATIRHLSPEVQVSTSSGSSGTTSTSIPPPLPSFPEVKVVSRKDLVGEYVGHTAVKTQKLLESCRGKVLFIDEAYSLLQEGRNDFGMEALTVLMEYMSTYPDRVVVIFAGYRDLMSKLFERQPGLERRCTWVFEIGNYNSDSLSEIFKQQLSRESLIAHPALNLTEFFRKNSEAFTSFGGDTERLAWYAGLVYSNVVTKNPSRENNYMIDAEILEGALKRLKDNSVKERKDMESIRHMYL